MSQESQQDHPKLIDEFGGAETGPRASYVDSVGRRVAAYSGVTPQAYRFTVLNSAVENAFATPGGYIYITRQLMGLMDDESQLAFALGHEVGHVAGNHAQARQSYSQRNTILGVLGAVLGSVVGGNVFGDMLSRGAMQAAQMRTLSFSRDQEYQADNLGMRYIVSAGYDPAGAAGVLAAITRATRSGGAHPGARQPPDAGMGEHPPAEREPHAARARRGAGDRPARHGPAQPRPVPRAAARASMSTTIRRRASSKAGPSRIPTSGSSSPCRRAI